MLPGMRFYIVSIVSIFTALGIGMYVGFSMDTQDFVLDQKENFVNVLESQFEDVTDESAEVKEENQELKEKNNYKDEYIESSYNFIVKNRLDDLKVGIIETNSDYMISNIKKDLELAGAEVKNYTTLNKSILEDENLDNMIEEIMESVANGQGADNLIEFKDQDEIDYTGDYTEPVDYLIISGGAFKESIDRINKVDKRIVDLARGYDIPIIGVEKSSVIYSYIDRYKELDITTVDNIDMTMGKAAMILAMEGITGNYGIKPSAKNILPRELVPVAE